MFLKEVTCFLLAPIVGVGTGTHALDIKLGMLGGKGEGYKALCTISSAYGSYAGAW
ncbi:hypothetical protein HanRHA438_Chr16g0750211 [Helianthus annuus]|uniref:Uncharacterized protein n=1 Tax=Helianthus annuus TaxID=4232 RepID=A0A9K3DR67_HELAN|nr:hypothetical protein HanXRQr2_Chr16g0738041 [Helianthus annuus]KAJ0437406.1 hypothetical protein HanHA300_Chr16g0601791 [Helianthus annuus]KAJ0441825.1 hypothetical protein HanIR_Chr16g0802221 [Helianthus annuus]KAJ0459725.1 hypothetical protein HanHA89_Chr16g0652321 [Helianthus annuus]KAJ0640198.1 hypothetical protein HanLR1_Chr16g0612601 [Helianthus annuus]